MAQPPLRARSSCPEDNSASAAILLITAAPPEIIYLSRSFGHLNGALPILRLIVTHSNGVPAGKETAKKQKIRVFS
jgi:hypothetical protein